jgi:hypothetical protein
VAEALQGQEAAGPTREAVAGPIQVAGARQGRAGAAAPTREAAVGHLAEVAAVPIPEEVAHPGAVVEAVDHRGRTDYAAEAAQSRFAAEPRHRRRPAAPHVGLRRRRAARH